MSLASGGVVVLAALEKVELKASNNSVNSLELTNKEIDV